MRPADQHASPPPAAPPKPADRQEPGRESAPDASAAPSEGPSGDPAPEQPAAPAPEPAPLPQAKVTVAADTLNAHVMKIGDEIRNSYHFENAVTRFDVFAEDMASELPIADEQANARSHIHDEAVTALLLERLQRRRVICLYGESELGKDSVALFLAHLVRGSHPEVDRPTLLVPPLDSRVRVNVNRLLRVTEQFGRRPIVFRNVLDRGNRDMRELFERIDQNAAAALSARLETIGSFLVFTATERTIAGEVQALEAAGIGAGLRLPSAALLRDALDRALIDVGLGHSPTDDDLESMALYGRTVPRIFQCIRKYGGALRENLTLAQAFSRIDDVESWFLNDLPASDRAWRFAFCLALAQPTARDEGVPWAEFTGFLDLLKRSIVDAVGGHEEGKAYARERTSEDGVLREARAVVERGAVSHVVRFQDANYPECIWSTILQHNRVILSKCYAALVSSAEGADITPVSARALRTIGRLSEIDPAAYLWPLARRWSSEDGFIAPIKIGLLFEGALGTKSPRYATLCERWLERFAASDATGEILAAIAICKQVGVSRTPLALRLLRQIAERRLAEPLEDTQRIEKLLLRIERKYQTQPQQSSATLLLEAFHELLADLGKRVYAQQLPLLVSLRYTLASLFLEGDPLHVVKELHHWGSGGGTSAALFTLLYLAKDGIADALASTGQVPPRAPTDERGIDHPLLHAMCATKEAPADVARFLEDVYGGFQHFFPPASARFFRRAFFAHITDVMIAATRSRAGLEELRAVMVRLLNSMNGDLSGCCHQFLTSVELRKHPDLAEFAAKTLAAALVPTPTPSPFTRRH